MTDRIVPFRLVFHWRCPDCAIDHYHHGPASSLTEEERKDSSAVLGCAEGDLMLAPTHVFCSKCEGKFGLDYGDEG